LAKNIYFSYFSFRVGNILLKSGGVIQNENLISIEEENETIKMK
jgi:hypothetical protein